MHVSWLRVDYNGHVKMKSLMLQQIEWQVCIFIDDHEAVKLTWRRAKIVASDGTRWRRLVTQCLDSTRTAETNSKQVARTEWKVMTDDDVKERIPIAFRSEMITVQTASHRSRCRQQKLSTDTGCNTPLNGSESSQNQSPRYLISRVTRQKQQLHNAQHILLQ